MVHVSGLGGRDTGVLQLDAMLQVMLYPTTFNFFGYANDVP
jgi:hypothetical protein